MKLLSTVKESCRRVGNRLKGSWGGNRENKNHCNNPEERDGRLLRGGGHGGRERGSAVGDKIYRYKCSHKHINSQKAHILLTTESLVI